MPTKAPGGSVKFTFGTTFVFGLKTIFVREIAARA